MFNFIKKLSFILIFTLLIGGSSVMASGKMEVGIGQEVQLSAVSDLRSPTYKWVVKKEDEIINTQSAKIFTFTFPSQGEYTVNLSATNEEVTQATTLHVLAGDRYPRPYSPEVNLDEADVSKGLEIALSTLPSLNSQNQVYLLGDGRLQFLLSGSKGNILEYRIDRNIFEDSDGNGVANDDIDNSSDDSYLTGGAWLATYKKNESAKIAAQITLVDQSGKKVSKQIEILFAEPNTTDELTAVLKTLPEVRAEDNLIHLYEDPHLVSFYARESKGNILEYRIDRNIFEDSDNDGDPQNDIDNLNDISFKTGDVFEVKYPKTDQQIIAQLIVVGKEGRGSRVQMGIVFGDEPIQSDLSDDPSSGIRLVSDRLLVLQGDPVTFSVEGLSLDLSEYNFAWDFNGDNELDKEVEAQNTIEHIYEEPGAYVAQVKIIDQQGNSAVRAVDIVVKEEVVTKADFSYEIDKNKVTFTNLSVANVGLSDSTLDYEWVFGDTDEENYELYRDQIKVENPVYEYKTNGKYLVTLVVTDAEGVINDKTVEIEITEAADPSAPDQTDEESDQGESGSSLWFKLLKYGLYLVIIVIGLIFLLITGLLVMTKIQHPDLIFEELVDELKLKILTMIGAHESDGASHQSADVPKPPTIDESLHEPTESVEAEVVSEAQQDNDSSTQTDDLNTTNSFQGSIDESSQPQPEFNQQGAMPDWLQSSGQKADDQPTMPIDDKDDDMTEESFSDEGQVEDPDSMPSWMKDREVVEAEAIEESDELTESDSSENSFDENNEVDANEENITSYDEEYLDSEDSNEASDVLDESDEESVADALSEDGQWQEDSMDEEGEVDESDMLDDEEVADYLDDQEADDSDDTFSLSEEDELQESEFLASDEQISQGQSDEQINEGEESETVNSDNQTTESSSDNEITELNQDSEDDSLVASDEDEGLSAENDEVPDWLKEA